MFTSMCIHREKPETEYILMLLSVYIWDYGWFLVQWAFQGFSAMNIDYLYAFLNYYDKDYVAT